MIKAFCGEMASCTSGSKLTRVSSQLLLMVVMMRGLMRLP